MGIMTKGITTTGAKKPTRLGAKNWSIQVALYGTDTEALTAAIDVEVTNDPLGMADPDSAAWIKGGTIELAADGVGAGIAVATDAVVGTIEYAFVRVNVTAITGVGATLDVFRGD